MPLVLLCKDDVIAILFTFLHIEMENDYWLIVILTLPIGQYSNIDIIYWLIVILTLPIG